MNVAQKIDGYISEHITENLSVPVLCKQFNLSKSHLYKLSEQSFGLGIAETARHPLRHGRINVCQLQGRIIEFDSFHLFAGTHGSGC
ncbi:hypothetical protein D3C75_882050 [compost metagenome]